MDNACGHDDMVHDGRSSGFFVRMENSVCGRLLFCLTQKRHENAPLDGFGASVRYMDADTVFLRKKKNFRTEMPEM